MRRAAVALALGLPAACAVPRSYMGVDLAVPAKATPTPLQRLALAARAGDKQAQYELATRFEGGVGVVEDLDRACRLYEAAAATTGGTIFIYSPPVGRERAGRVIPISTPVSQGLPMAGARLSALAYRAGGGPDAPGCLARHR